MQKKSSSKIHRYLPVARLNRGDIAEIIAALRDISVTKLRIESDDYVLESADELEQLDGIQKNFYIRGDDPFVTIDISSGFLPSRITIYENGMRAEGLCARIEKIFERRRVKLSEFRKFRYALIGISITGLTIAFVEKWDLLAADFEQSLCMA